MLEFLVFLIAACGLAVLKMFLYCYYTCLTLCLVPIVAMVIISDEAMHKCIHKRTPCMVMCHLEEQLVALLQMKLEFPAQLFQGSHGMVHLLQNLGNVCVEARVLVMVGGVLMAVGVAAVCQWTLNSEEEAVEEEDDEALLDMVLP